MFIIIPSWCGETSFPHPKSRGFISDSRKFFGGGEIAPQALLLTSAVCPLNPPAVDCELNFGGVNSADYTGVFAYTNFESTSEWPVLARHVLAIKSTESFPSLVCLACNTRDISFAKLGKLLLLPLASKVGRLNLVHLVCVVVSILDSESSDRSSTPREVSRQIQGQGEFLFAGVNSACNTRDFVFTYLASTIYLPVCAIYLGNQVDGEFTIAGVYSAYYTGDFVNTNLESTRYMPVFARLCLPLACYLGLHGRGVVESFLLFKS